jgi:hypothetical protein
VAAPALICDRSAQHWRGIGKSDMVCIRSARLQPLRRAMINASRIALN